MEKLSKELLLRTKLAIPQRRSCLIERPRLMARLAAAPPGGLILISAPAGFGKTTLITEWTAVNSKPLAWFSLDEADNQPHLFWRYVVAALRTTNVPIGAEIDQFLRADPAPDWDASGRPAA